jgi:hypothetical protein
LNLGSFDDSTLSILCGESRLLVSWCAGDRCNMAGSDNDRGRSRRSGAEDRGWSSTCQILGGRMIERSGDAVCDLHRAQRDQEHEFLGLGSKSRSTISPGLTSKWWLRVFRFGPQNRQLRFSDLGHKITATVS